MPKNFVSRLLVNRKSVGTNELCWTIAFLIPSLILFGLFLLYPLLQTIQLSFTDWNGMAPTMHYVGISNYLNVLNDHRFLMALVRTAYFCLIHIVLAVGGGLMLAVLISQVRWAKTLFRALGFIPNVLSLSVIGVLWSQIYNPQFGLINTFLQKIGLGFLENPWLGDKHLVLTAIGIASSWQAYGFYMVIFIAGIQMIDNQLYEAAYIDGAGGWQQFRNITIPSLHNTISFVVTVAFMSGLKGFGTVWAMTGGGPVNHSELAVVYIWRSAFQGEGMLGNALAASVIFGILVIAITVLFNQFRDKSVNS